MAASSSGPKLVNVEVTPRNETFKRITRNAQHTQINDVSVRLPAQPQNVVTIDTAKSAALASTSSKYVINRSETLNQKPPPPQVHLKNSEISFNLPAKWKRLLVKGEVVYVR